MNKVVRKKVLLMGRSGSGKTSMRTILFSNYLPTQTRQLQVTIDVNHSQISFLGNYTLNLWDCGGQKQFMDMYLGAQKSQTFKKVEALIYVFDVTSETFDKDIQEYRAVLERLYEYSPDAKLFTLIHKMDVFEEDEKDYQYLQKEGKIKLVSKPFRVVSYPTSIYDDTLYSAWSAITYSLIPMITEVEDKLNSFCNFIEADEIVVYEASSLLVISYSSRVEFDESRRFENISTSIKSFYHSCTDLKKTQFKNIRVELPDKKVYFDTFTSSTFIMVIFSNPCLTFTNVAMNVKAIRNKFEDLIGFKGDDY
ncbi:GTP-binding protein, putative [Entamoeba histolytica HM-1:IMSS-B]|uniref:GTP-binding protein, putative n=7 Tax=Entamoeba TaxID=5758 RepID=C4LUU1_ENTH1|nr:GTP-binding protein, putative [Entamoeba nuttalli P19]XP_656247.1 GTP-binding protein, putative [Entamoeba histolytica HM-1:IMSS]EMD49057.1 GTP-binding protein, putative [Entamoeba histolytica KU27]EMH72755.1 GTP-binding protein, putative [Entamoeba histolytica HM-1:IMSS-B]EMS17419.1 GTP-binding protein [Entamoeba histolytica HM-3:IMSS]ENY61457.1 GTP-binding protein, putative [Entamoeba histolytica HM-1:IMSS-A]GAT92401.1 GTP-binding protein putative [Entamoeba histolytica]|eukprot:XP_008860650.1 GTP-binding protein, putative [Entamoeba nuttalli P19]